MGGLNNKHVFHMVWRLGGPRSSVTDPVSAEASLPGLQMAFFSLCPYWRRTEGGAQSLVSYYKSTNPIHEGFTLMT